MVPPPTSSPRQREPLFDVHPQTGASIEVFYPDHTLEAFGGDGAGWFWWVRRRGFSPDGSRTAPLDRRTHCATRIADGAKATGAMHSRWRYQCGINA